ncbi:MAG TPA: serine hydrolase domain-containing protein [Steroidobacteraceae bacterium]
MNIPSLPAASRPWSRASAIDRVIDDAIDTGRIVGMVMIAALDGAIVYRRAAGLADRESRRPVRSDDCFRLASMTKAIVSVTALALVDLEVLRLEDPVTRWLPEFRPRLETGREPVITLHHLFTHSAGLTYGFLEAPDGPYHQLGISDGLDQAPVTLHENVRRIAAAPLLFEPGERWNYSVGVDVLGAVIERATGSTLPEAVRKFVSEPLAMDSLEFVAPRERFIVTAYADAEPVPVRMSNPYRLSFVGGTIDYAPERAFDRNAFPSGGTGMVGDAIDYLRFLEAIRTGGAGVLEAATAAAMTRSALGELGPSPGCGFGLGVQVLADPVAAQTAMNPGSWSWGGVYGTHFWVDPAAALTVVVLTNTGLAGTFGEFPSALQRAAYPNT